MIGAKARWVAALAVLLFIGAQARAQVAPAGVAIEMGAWRFTPIVTAGQPATVHGFLALMNPTIAEGQNITAVWYQASVNGWQKTAWVAASEWAVIELLKGQLGIGDGADADWETWQEKSTPAPEASAAGEAYEGGFFVADALGQAVNTLANRDDIVALLVELGYAGADLPGESSELETCRRDLVLDAMAAGVETQLATGTGGEQEAHDVLAACTWRFCIPWTFTTAGPTPWVGGPPPNCWTYTSTQYVTNSSIIKCWYSCSFTQTRTRTLTHRYLDCTWSPACVQTQTRTVTLRGYCLLADLDCPAVPECVLPMVGTGTASPGGDWVPACNF